MNKKIFPSIMCLLLGIGSYAPALNAAQADVDQHANPTSYRGKQLVFAKLSGEGITHKYEKIEGEKYVGGDILLKLSEYEFLGIQEEDLPVDTGRTSRVILCRDLINAIQITYPSHNDDHRADFGIINRQPIVEFKKDIDEFIEGLKEQEFRGEQFIVKEAGKLRISDNVYNSYSDEIGEKIFKVIKEKCLLENFREQRGAFGQMDYCLGLIQNYHDLSNKIDLMQKLFFHIVDDGNQEHEDFLSEADLSNLSHRIIGSIRLFYVGKNCWMINNNTSQKDIYGADVEEEIEYIPKKFKVSIFDEKLKAGNGKFYFEIPNNDEQLDALMIYKYVESLDALTYEYQQSTNFGYVPLKDPKDLNKNTLFFAEVKWVKEGITTRRELSFERVPSLLIKHFVEIQKTDNKAGEAIGLLDNWLEGCLEPEKVENSFAAQTAQNDLNNYYPFGYILDNYFFERPNFKDDEEHRRYLQMREVYDFVSKNTENANHGQKYRVIKEKIEKLYDAYANARSSQNG